MSDAQRRAQQGYMERALDLLEDVALSEEELERQIPDVGLGSIPALDIIDAYRRRIARWQPPGPGRTSDQKQAQYEAYLRLQRLVAGLANNLVYLVQAIEHERP